MTRSPAGPPVGGQVHALTPRGRGLEDVVLAQGRWGSRTEQTAAGPLGTDALVLALRTSADPARLAGWSARLELRVEGGGGPDQIVLAVDGGRLAAVRGAADRPVLGAASGGLRPPRPRRRAGRR